MRKSSNIAYMARGIYIFIAMLFVATANAASVRGVSTASRSGVATARNQTDNPAASYTYNYMYPYLNNQMRTTLKPADPTTPSTSPINAVVRTEQLSAPRRVVARPNTNVARAATNINTTASTQRRVVARPSANTARVATNNNPRRVVARPNANANIARNTSRVQDMFYPTENPISKTSTSARCLADYAECMNMYCERADTAYNRCYCSARLAQIDAEYQPEIESPIQQIVLLKSGGGDAVDTSELNEYWASTVSKYTGDNSWANLDDALDIDWATMESRVRGQNAFITGHEYCSQHISGCFYMSDNLRDAYRSTISKDCAAYESSLQRLKSVAESVIEAYQE